MQTEVGEAEQASLRKLGALQLDVDGYRAFFDGRELCVSASQIEALNILLANQGRVVSREELSAALGLARPRSVDVILSSLRREVGRDFLRNVRSRGWIVVAEALQG